MSVYSSVKNPFLTIDKLILSILPETRVAQTLWWISLPLISLFFNLGISFLIPCVSTVYLPFLALLGVSITIRWKGIGLAISYLLVGVVFFLVYKKVPSADLLWQSGVLFSLALELYIVLLCSEEIETIILDLQNTAEEQKVLLSKVSEEQERASERWQEEREELEEEIKKWKEEAEQRRIEKRAIDKRLSLVQSEIDFLTQQKETLIEEAFNSRALAAERLRRLEEQVEEMGRLSSSIQPLQIEKEKGEEIKENLTRTLAQREQSLENLRQELATLHAAYVGLNTDKQLLESNIQTLREEILTYRTLIEEEKEKREKAIQSLLVLEKEKEESQQYTQEMTERFAITLSEMEEKLHKDVNPEEVVLLKREKARIEGLYTQLREQFEEKSGVLSQTRKELFQLQGKLLAYERDNLLQSSDSKMDVNYLEYGSFLSELLTLDKDRRRLEEEIILMEELISQILAR